MVCLFFCLFVLQTVRLYRGFVPKAALALGQRVAPDMAAGCKGAFVRFSDNNPTATLLRAETGWMAY